MSLKKPLHIIYLFLMFKYSQQHFKVEIQPFYYFVLWYHNILSEGQFFSWCLQAM